MQTPPLEKVTIETTVQAPLEIVWDYWNNPDHVKQWNAASDDWHTPEANNDLRVGGTFSYRMEAKDKSFGFNFYGTYNEVIPMERIVYTIGDERVVEVTFEKTVGGVKVTEVFEAEDQNPVDMQRDGWQSILNRFKEYVEKKSSQ